jgi:predicted RNA-binding protein with PIN domain
VAELLIIDGDNVAHRLVDAVPERRRDDLLTLVSAYAEQAGTDVVVIFDGHGSDMAIGRVSVQHAQSETADSVIERLAHRRSETDSVTVVSSDTVLRHVAHRDPVHVMSAREFVERLGSQGATEAPRSGSARQRFQVGDALDPAARAALEEMRRRGGSRP